MQGVVCLLDMGVWTDAWFVTDTDSFTQQKTIILLQHF